MDLPTDFQFSQANLQDFLTCPRRFELRYLQRLHWPAVEAEPVREAERMQRLGTDFHRLVQQHLVGLDETLLGESLVDSEPELQEWWDSYLAHRPAALAGARLYPELTLSTPFAGYRLTARYDVLAVQPDGTLLIIDWKTAPQKPQRDVLARRVQTRLYPYVVAAAGAAYNDGQPVAPETISMMYWYPQTPAEPEVFDYSAAQFEQDRQFLADTIAQITTRTEKQHFPLVEDDKPCRHCVYRSFCDRGIQAGSLLEQVEAELEPVDLSGLEWDQIAEIQF